MVDMAMVYQQPVHLPITEPVPWPVHVRVRFRHDAGKIVVTQLKFKQLYLRSAV